MTNKRYTHSLVLGKFYPPHKGHLFLIDTAAAQSEKVYVMACHNTNQVISGNIRVQALREVYAHTPHVQIISVDDGHLPQVPSEAESVDAFYALWVSLVYAHVPRLDAVFTSEEYGDEFARYLGVEHFLVDQARTQVPVSGTKVRSNAFLYWEYIPVEIRPYFVKTVAIMGPESVGKSTLTQRLAEYFQSNFVPEWGREVYEKNGNHMFITDIAEILEICRKRQDMEHQAKRLSHKILFCDTEDMTTDIFAKMFFPEKYTEIAKDMQKILEHKHDIYLLLQPDCPAIQDGTREFLHRREEHYLRIKAELDARACRYMEIGGNWEERFRSAVEIVASLFGSV